MNQSLLAIAATCAMACGAVAAAQPAAFTPPLQVPAAQSPLAARTPLNALARAGDRLVAAGQRGHILYSDDGRQWLQAKVPVSSDLVALAFPSARQGWAVGHDGVVLHSADAGATWTKQLDGRQVAALLLQHYGQRAQAGDAAAQPWLKTAEAFVAQGADKPFLGVWFEDERVGYVVGAFNLILRTDDGGQSWVPWLDRVDNPKEFHLYAIRPAAGTLFAVGEQGLVLKLDRSAQRFRAVEVPYKGSFFGVTGTPDMVLAFGLRGNAVRSTDGGASWRKVETGTSAGIADATLLADASVVMVTQSGDVLRSSDGGASFRKTVLQRSPAFAVAGAAGTGLAIAGARGVRLEALN